MTSHKSDTRAIDKTSLATEHKSEHSLCEKPEEVKITVWQLLKPAHRVIFFSGIIAAIGAVISVIPYMAISEFAKIWVLSGRGNQISTSYLPHTLAVNLWFWLLSAVLSALISQILYGISLGIAHLGEANLRYILRKNLVSLLGKLPLGKLQLLPNGTIRKMVADDTKSIHTLVAHVAGDFTYALVSLLTGIIYLFLIDWKIISVLIFIWFFVVCGVLIIGMFRMRPLMKDFGEAQTNLAAATVEMVEGIKEIKNFQATDSTKTNFDYARKHFTDLSYHWSKSFGNGLAFGISFLRPGVIFSTVALVSTLFVATGESTLWQTLPFFLIAMGIPSGLITIISLTQHIYEAQQAAKDTAKLMSEPPMPEGNTPNSCTQCGEITLENISFAYPDGPDVIKNISLHIPAKQVTALVGPSGGGKSTLATLIARFHDVNSGVIKVSGFDIRTVSHQFLMNQISLVFQDVNLMHASIRENIALGAPNATTAEIEAAAKAVLLHEKILSLPQGYDTVIGDEGGILSGGEKQRLTIARAYIQNTPIIILDEATAMADPQSECEIHQALSRLAENKTVIIIAHRLGTICDASQIAVIADGTIAECGTHKTLIAKDGIYKQMWSRQYPQEKN